MVPLSLQHIHNERAFQDGAHGLTFEEVHQQVEERADRALKDVTVPTSRLRATPEGLIEVPGVGELALSDWSKNQLARLVGIRWDRWFSSAFTSPEERQQELNRRLSRLGLELTVRSRRHDRQSDSNAMGDGVLRAFLSAGYQAIDDHVLFDRLASIVGSFATTLRFSRIDVTDRSSHFVALGTEKFSVGQEGGRPDWHYAGLVIRNSEVGYASLTMEEFLWRLVCANGLIVSIGGAQLLHRRHRGNREELLTRQLAYAFSQLPSRWNAAQHLLTDSAMIRIDDIEAALKELAKSHVELRPHVDAVIGAYAEEPTPSRFGMVQAITRAAGGLPDPDDRFQLERLAGRLLSNAGNASHEEVS